MRTCLLLALVSVVAVGHLSAEESKDILARAKIATNCDDNNDVGPVRFAKADSIVIRSAEELVANSSRPDMAKDADVQKETTRALAKLLQVESIDWNKQMIVAARAQRSTTANAFQFVSMTPQDKTLTITWALRFRFVPGIPKGLALIDRFDGEVKFARTDTK
jgi:hypothetical protein